MASDKNVATHKRVADLLDKGSLHEAFTILKKQQSLNSIPSLSDKISKLEETYKYMIHYLVEGYADSGREDMLTSLIEDLRVVNDSLLRNSILTDSPDSYSSAKRYENIRKSSLKNLIEACRNTASKAELAAATDKAIQFRKEADDALDSLFSYIWTMYGAPEGEYRLLTETVKNSEPSFSLKSQIISALMLGNLSYYDRNALTALIDIYEADIDQKISARALVAIMLIIANNSSRIKSDPRLRARLSLWQDSIINYRRLREVLMSIIKTRDTERISSKMQNEVLPELMKLKPEIISKLKNITEEADMEMLDVNPEWEEIMNKNGLGDKLKELTEMQMEGGDVMMVAFSNLKTFPFFNKVANWFLPFSSSHSDLAMIADDFQSFAEILDMEGVMCDSDKYSFAFSLNQMPESQRKMIAGRMSEQMGQLREALADKKLKSSLPEFDAEVTRYVRDLYRFFKLYRKKNDFNDPFARPLDFRQLPYLNELLSDTEIINLVGEFYFKRGYYSEALPMLMLMEKEEENSGNHLLWEKIGYCHNALNNLEEAIKWYKKAELLNPGSQWLIKKLAVCSRMLERYDEAAEYYEKALEADPENYSLLMSAGNCLLECGNITAAIANFYHADYIRPEKQSTWRALGWAELMNGNKEKSLVFYSKLINSDNPSANDFLNAGHLNYLSGNLKKAVEYYTRSASFPDSGIEKFEASIKEDIPTLTAAGGKPEELNLIVEKVKYNLD